MRSPTTPISGGRAVFPTSGAPDSCEMALARGLGTHERRAPQRSPLQPPGTELAHCDSDTEKPKGAGRPGLGGPAFLRCACRNQHDAVESPALPLGAWIFFLVWTQEGPSTGEEQWGGATSIPIRKTEEFAASSLDPGNTDLSQPPQGALVSPPEDEARCCRPQDRDGCQGWCTCISHSEEKLDPPGNCSVVASDLYVTLVYNGIFFTIVLITGILYVCSKILRVNLRLSLNRCWIGENPKHNFKIKYTFRFKKKKKNLSLSTSLCSSISNK